MVVTSEDSQGWSLMSMLWGLPVVLGWGMEGAVAFWFCLSHVLYLCFSLWQSFGESARNSFRLHWRSDFQTNGGKQDLWDLRAWKGVRERPSESEREREREEKKWKMDHDKRRKARERPQKKAYLHSSRFWVNILTNNIQAIPRSPWRHHLPQSPWQPPGPHRRSIWKTVRHGA